MVERGKIKAAPVGDGCIFAGVEGLDGGYGWNLVEDFGPFLGGAGGVGLLVEGVSGDEGESECGLGVDHLLVGEIDLAPGAGFFEGGAGECTVTGVGDGDLDGVLVHGGIYAEDLRGDDDVLGEVLGGSAAEHEEAGGGVGDFELGELVEVFGGVDGDHRLALTCMLVGDEAEAGRAVGEGGDEDGDILLVGCEDDGVDSAVLGGLAFALKVGTHLADELAGAVGAGLEGVGDLVGDFVADAELVFVDEGVVDAVDGEFAEYGVFVAVLVLVVGDVVLEAEGLEEVLIDDVGAGGDDGVDHVVADHVDEDLLEAGGDHGASDAEDDATFGVAEHHVVDGGCAVGVAGAIGHVLHGVDQRDYVVLLDIDVLDRTVEEFFFIDHGRY